MRRASAASPRRIADRQLREAARFTRAGFDLLGEARAVVAGVYADHAAMIGVRELRALRDSLDRLVAEIEAEERRIAPDPAAETPAARVRRARARTGPRRRR
jgi:hypothetical protein